MVKQTQKDHIVTIATFYDPFKAQVLKTRLESEGIPCYLADGNLLPTAAFFSDEGGVKLKVRQEDIERVKAIILDTK